MACTLTVISRFFTLFYLFYMFYLFHMFVSFPRPRAGPGPTRQPARS